MEIGYKFREREKYKKYELYKPRMLEVLKHYYTGGAFTH